jgi:hypothetical protein
VPKGGGCTSNCFFHKVEGFLPKILQRKSENCVFFFFKSCILFDSRVALLPIKISLDLARVNATFSLFHSSSKKPV